MKYQHHYLFVASFVTGILYYNELKKKQKQKKSMLLTVNYGNYKHVDLYNAVESYEIVSLYVLVLRISVYIYIKYTNYLMDESCVGISC